MNLDQINECLKVAADLELFGPTGVPPDIALDAMRTIRKLVNEAEGWRQKYQLEVRRFEEQRSRTMQAQARANRLAVLRKRRHA